MIAEVWSVLALYAEQPSSQISLLLSGTIAALVTAAGLFAIAVYNRRSQQKLERHQLGLDARRVGLDEFVVLRDTYKSEVLELREALRDANEHIEKLEATVRMLQARLGII